MTTQRTAVLFDTPPIIGHTYTLTHWINRQPHTATLIDLVDKIDDYGTTPSGERATQLNTYAIFQDCETGQKFKRIIIPEVE